MRCLGAFATFFLVGVRRPRLSLLFVWLCLWLHTYHARECGLVRFRVLDLFAFSVLPLLFQQLSVAISATWRLTKLLRPVCPISLPHRWLLRWHVPVCPAYVLLYESPCVYWQQTSQDEPWQCGRLMIAVSGIVICSGGTWIYVSMMEDEFLTATFWLVSNSMTQKTLYEWMWVTYQSFCCLILNLRRPSCLYTFLRNDCAHFIFLIN